MGKALTKEQIDRVRYYLNLGVRTAEIANMMGVTQACVQKYAMKIRGRIINKIPVDRKRKQGEKLDSAKAAEVRAAYNDREPIRDAAKRLELCETCVGHWYEVFRSGGRHPTEPEPQRRALPQRHYQGNFEL